MIMCSLGIFLLAMEVYFWLKRMAMLCKSSQIEPLEQPQQPPKNEPLKLNHNRFNPNIASYGILNMISILFAVLLIIPLVIYLLSNKNENFLGSTQYFALLKDLGFCSLLPLVICAKNKGLRTFIASHFTK